MGLFRVYNFVLQSQILLENLTASVGDSPTWYFQLLPRADSNFPEYDWLDHKMQDNGSPWPSIARHEASYILRFPEIADYEFTPASRMIRCFAAPHIPLNTISHLLLDQVLPRALCHLGETILHASSVAINGQAVAFMGETGSGKSTLCASLCKQGFPLITDDSLLVKLEADHFIAYSSYPALRLWSDSVGMFSGASTEMRRVAHYNEKNFLNVTDNTLVFSEDAMPLQRVYLLGDVTRNVSIEPVLPRDIATEIIKASFPLDNTDKDRLKQDFVLFTQMANIIPFYRLSYPRDVASLPDVHQAILEHQP